MAVPVGAARWWKVQKLPTGEVQLTLFPGASPVPGKVVTRVALALLLGLCAWVAVEKSQLYPAIFSATFVILLALILRAYLPAEQVWLLRPGHARRRIAGEEGEATFEVASVKLQWEIVPDVPGGWLRAWLIGPGQKVEVGKPCGGRRSTECEALARTLSEALAVPLVRGPR